MTTLLAVFGPKGFLGACSASCYKARLPSATKPDTHNPCLCVCGGANHGAGLNQALRAVQRGVGFRPGDLEHFAHHRDLDPATLVVIDRTRVSKERAAAMAKAKLAPVPLAPDDLFYCEGLAAPISEAPEPALGSGVGAATNTASPPGDLK